MYDVKTNDYHYCGLLNFGTSHLWLPVPILCFSDSLNCITQSFNKCTMWVKFPTGFIVSCLFTYCIFIHYFLCNFAKATHYFVGFFTLWLLGCIVCIYILYCILVFFCSSVMAVTWQILICISIMRLTLAFTCSMDVWGSWGNIYLNYSSYFIS